MGVRGVGVDEKLADLRGHTLAQLERRGTTDAIDQMQRLVAAFPKESWLRLRLADMRRNWNRDKWQAHSPAEVLTLALGASKRPEHDFKRALEAKASADFGSPTPVRSTAQLLNIAESIVKPSPAPTLLPGPAKSRRYQVLAVADEWASRRGGISTFNRGLCIALATAGCSVRCLVLEASDDEVKHAAQLSVTLEVVKPQLGIIGHQLLLTWTPSAGYVPDVVIGHDHVTGRYARYIAKELLHNAFFVHVVHTVPEEIEPYKDLRSGKSTVAYGYDKRLKQIELCERAELVVAVGPRIEEYVRADLPERLDSRAPRKIGLP